MSAFDPKTAKEAFEMQKAKYPDMSAEMKRRGAMTKTRGTGGGFKTMKENDPERFKQMLIDREEKRRAKKESE